jgi:hypothetical protein
VHVHVGYAAVPLRVFFWTDNYLKFSNSANLPDYNMGHVAWMEEGRGVYRVLVGKPEGKRPLGRGIDRWEDNIKMDLQEVGCGGMDLIEVAQDRQVTGTCVCANDCSGSIKCGKSLD